MTALYVPGVEETDQKKLIRSQQLVAGQTSTNTDSITTINTTLAAGLVNSIAGNNGAFTLTGGITNTVNAIKLSLTNVSLQASVASPTGTTSATGVMMGLGSTFKLTPAYSTRVYITISGYFSAASAVIGETAIYFGTSTAPTNGAAFTGTKVGSDQFGLVSATASNMPFSKSVIITGLTPATAYWFDLRLISNNGTSVAVVGVDFAGFEF